MNGFIEYAPVWLATLGRALINTAIVTIAGFAVASAVGLVIALLSLNQRRALRSAATLYVGFFRGVPVLVILYLGYFGLPSLHVSINALTVAILGLGLYYAAQMAEVIRSGFLAIAKGQHESALAVGFSPLQALYVVILPQVTRVIVPPVIVTFVGALKDSSLASLITVKELMLEGNVLSNQYAMPLQVFIWVGLFYFVFALPLSLFAKRLKRHMERSV